MRFDVRQKMKPLALALLYTALLGGLVADQPRPLEDEVTGIWWVSVKVTRGGELDWDRRWIIERTSDGRYRRRDYMVDPKRKAYAPLHEQELTGTWRILDGPLINYNGGPGRIWSNSIKIKNDVITWKDSSMSGPPVDWDCTEVRIEKFVPQVDASFRLLTADEFRAQNTNNGEQGVAPQSATRSESDSEGNDKPQPESKPRPR